ncbi:hypothetical protein CMV_002310 [Castanea mollissima]|uniref:Uncharacterized protein n=1 Tax=Castanea mollissima TaxID=60419 RepID=A0A8J4RYU3_9ROSI|nr:hypothetical protein CMV_002310 [Castanea mollissima]
MSSWRFPKTKGSVEGQQENSGGQKDGTEAASVGEGKEEGIGGGGRDQDEGSDGGVTGGAGDQDEGSDGGITGGGGDQDEGRDRGIGGGGGNRDGDRDIDVEDSRSMFSEIEKAIGGKNSRPMKIVEIFIAVIAQSTAAVIAVDFLGISTGTKDLLYCALITNLFGFVCCTAALWQSDTQPETAKLLGKIGSAAATLGFILMVAMILPIYLLWIIGVACLALLVVFVISLKSS